MCYQIIHRLVDSILIDDLSEKYSHFIQNKEFRMIKTTFETLNLEFIEKKSEQNFYQIKVHQ